MKSTIFCVVLFFPLLLISQNCDCESNFNWVKKTFEENDAGYQYIIESKGAQAYVVHNQIFLEKTKNISSNQECTEVLNEWLQFFRSGHIGVQYIGTSESESNMVSKNTNNKNTTEERETYSADIDKFKTYLDLKQEHDFEGIWKSGAYSIAIKKKGNDYIGFIVASEYEEWNEGDVKLKVFSDGQNHNSVFYMFDRSAVKSNSVSLLGSNNLKIGDIFLVRTYPEIVDNSPYNLYIRSMESSLPFLEVLNNSTLYFRVPSFTGTQEKRAIDSVITANKDKILSTENLILDIRNGTGGADFTYSEIMKLIYTNPIRMPSVEYLSTPLNNKRMLDFSKNEGLAITYNITFSEEERDEFKRHYDLLSKNLGQYVNIYSLDINIKKYDTVYPYPKNVGIIHNKNNGSTDEQFLLEAKQSRKVKLFGEPTAGMIDMSNMNTAESPCGDYLLWYALTKSLRVPGMAIDNVGVQPDYYIDSEIPEHEWVQYVVDVLSQY